MSGPPVSKPQAGPRSCAADPLAALRGATQALHQRLDAALPVAREGAGRAEYVQHLRASGLWLTVLAPWLARLEPALPPRRALEAIASDLAACGGAAIPVPPPGSGAGLRAACDGSLAFCWGVAYVAEGAALGGQVLLRRLSPTLAAGQMRYLSGAGAATGARWRQVCAGLRTGLVQAADVRAACSGAVAAFEAFGNAAAD